MFQLTISKVNEVLFHGEADSVNCPGSAGELTVLSHHAPLVTTLKAGEIRIKTPEGQTNLPVAHGILEVSNNKVVILL